MLDRLGELIDKNPCLAMATALFVGGALGVTLVACDCQSEAAASAETADELNVEHANESPLDAVVYDAPPVFASYGSSNAYKITDRFSKSEWWLVKIGAEWVVLPITNTEVTNVG